jgi:ABC-2 type transport system ATP-binding protein
MINVQDVTMHYPIPKRYIELLLKPFSRKNINGLDNVSLNIQHGDSVAFLGANGAGKTTLLKLIGGLLYPTKGSVMVNGYDTVKHNMKARKNVGFVLNEERSFYWRLTGRQNLEFFGTLDNLHGNSLKNKIEELLDVVKLKDASDTLFAGYSSGMKQKLAIARGLLSDADILILDEPTRALDPIFAEEITNILLKRIHFDKERTLLIATHRLDEAKTLCNKICIMKKGYILTYDTTSNLIGKYGSLVRCYNEIVGIN